jgi:competence protein ComFC
MRLKTTTTKIYSWLINLLFPIKCLHCGVLDTMLCFDCLSLVKKPHTIADNNIVAITSYKDKYIKRALWLLKFHNRKMVADAFGVKLYEELVAQLEDRTLFENFVDPILIPIPLSKKRLHERGYNQAELLARALVRNSGEKIPIETNALFKVRETDRQALIRERSRRLGNLTRAFNADSTHVRGKNIVLIDDITTTGATIIEARRALKKAGARKVLALTVAH